LKEIDIVVVDLSLLYWKDGLLESKLLGSVGFVSDYFEFPDSRESRLLHLEFGVLS
jgi:hypothetical protein